jgi:predicted  nucleic acid-binding Zn-ribbon protein
MAVPDDALPAAPAASEPTGAANRHPLLLLQELDLSVDRLGGRLRQVESGEGLATARRAMAQAEARLSDLRLSIEEVEREQRRLENDIDSMQHKIDAEERRLYDGSVANARELQSIRAEVDNLRTRRTRMEDELIDRMERREELDAHTGHAEAEVAEGRARVAEIEETSGREIVEIEQALNQRAAERLDLLPRIGEDLLSLYEDLRRQKKGVGAAALLDGVCQACHQKLSAVYLSKLRVTDGIRRCEYCRRILVLD